MRTELPVESGIRGRGGLTPLLAIMPNLAPPAPIAPLERKRTRVEQLQELERELSDFLRAQAPATWIDMRRTLWRLIRRARRELRAAERARAAAHTSTGARSHA